MQPATIRSYVYYRCEFREEEAALYPDLTHPRTVYLREDILGQALDRWIARAFAPDRLSATVEALTHASAAASTAEPQTPEQAQTRRASKESERQLARHQAALDAGADPAAVTQWINEALRDKDAARKKLDAHPAVPQKKQSPLDTRQIRQITASLGDIAQRIQSAAAEQRAALRRPGYHHQLRTRNEDRDCKVEALVTVSSIVVSEGGLELSTRASAH
ncbi:hypothetical protein [Streptomyces sp. NPDC007905]|uniref:hypothetical protein n=1 Tax=Streptomyces sp. NPDC007905 TaxID=3364788 RepID=UPI0036E681DA